MNLRDSAQPEPGAHLLRCRPDLAEFLEHTLLVLRGAMPAPVSATDIDLANPSGHVSSDVDAA
jgi:hypothetical protein